MMLRWLLLPFFMLLLAADAPPPENPYRIYFLGDSGIPAQRAFSMLEAAVRKFQPALFAKVKFIYIDLGPVNSGIDAPLQRLARQKPDMVVALSGRYAAAATHSFAHTPIIFSSFEDPVQHGIVSSMRSRREPVCGISLVDSLEGKRLEILKQAFPAIRNIAVLADWDWAETMGGRARLEQEAARQGLHVSLLLAKDLAQAKALFLDGSTARHDAWYIPATPLADDATPFIIEQMRTWKKPNMWTSKEEVQQGAQMAYSQETSFVWRSFAELIFRVHSGEPPGTIPILRPTHFTLTVRMAPEGGMPAPDISIVRRADHVIR